MQVRDKPVQQGAVPDVAGKSDDIRALFINFLQQERRLLVDGKFQNVYKAAVFAGTCF